MSWIAASATLVALACTLGAPPATAQESSVVHVAANRFDPFEVAVAPGGAVTWVVQEGGHTIVADDGRFALRGEGGTSLPTGTTVTVVAGAVDEFVRYHCDIHGGPGLQGMSGRIRVGDPPPPPPHESPIIRVPADEPSIADALAVARPGHHIELSAGTYPVAEPVTVTVDDVTITGTASRPALVRLIAAPGQRGFPESGFHVTAHGVRIANLALTGFRGAGVHLDGASRATVTDVEVDGGGLSLEGILVEGVTGATLRRTATTGARRSGIRIADCATCGVRLDDVRSGGNLVGILVESASGVLVERATVTDNAAGIIARTDRTLAATRPTVIALHDSTVSNNTHRGPVTAARMEDRWLATGAGIWLRGTADTTVVGNVVSGNGYGIVAAGDVAARTEVTGNLVDRNSDGDLAWDGIGARVCFAGNGGGDGEPTSEPPLIQTLYPCDSAVAGVPYPIVALRLWLRALL